MPFCRISGKIRRKICHYSIIIATTVVVCWMRVKKCRVAEFYQKYSIEKKVPVVSI